MLADNWPGNVRELKSAIRRAVLLADEMITMEHLDLKILPQKNLELTLKIDTMLFDCRPLKTIVKEATIDAERKLLDQVIKYTKGNKAKAARMLDVDYKTIHTKLKKFGIVYRRGI